MHSGGTAKHPISTKQTITIIVIVVAAVGIAWWLISATPAAPSNSATADASTKSQVLTIQLNCHRWSDWVELPLDLKSWECETPDWIEFKFLNGYKKSFKKGEKFWWKETPAKSFKVRGGGPTLTLLISR